MASICHLAFTYPKAPGLTQQCQEEETTLKIQRAELFLRSLKMHLRGKMCGLHSRTTLVGMADTPPF